MNNIEHYKWGDDCDGWWLKKEGNFTVILEQMPPDTFEIKHYHETSEQFFYCLEGQIEFEIGTQVTIIKKGESLSIPHKMVHQVFNRSHKVVKFLVVSSHNSHGDRVEL